MHLSKFIKILLLLLLTYSTAFGEIELNENKCFVPVEKTYLLDEDSLKTDTTKSVKENVKSDSSKKLDMFYMKNMLLTNNMLGSGFYIPGSSFSYIQPNYYGITLSGTNTNYGLSNYFYNIYSINSKQGLGFFSKVLSYAQSAAAAYFLYKSVSKYGLGFNRTKKSNKQ